MTGIESPCPPAAGKNSSRDAADPPSPLVYTGERYHPEVLGEIRQEHLHRYLWAQEMVAGLDVADIASGEGFGSSMLALRAHSVVGVDLSQHAVDHATLRYRSANLRFACADASQMPLPDHSVDAIVSFETIEHLGDQDGALAEMRRILKPRGFLVISSPDREVYSDRQGHRNPFHTKELTGAEFSTLVRRHFPCLRLFGQRLSVASSILSSDRDEAASASVYRDAASADKDASAVPRPMYSIGVAAAKEAVLPPMPASFLVSAGYDVYWQMRDRAATLEAELKRLAAENEALRWHVSVRTILSSGLFVPSYYLAHAGIEAREDFALVEDYLMHGERNGLMPSPDFDPRYYLASNPDIADAGVSPLLHYLEQGKIEGRMPKPGSRPPTPPAVAGIVPAIGEQQPQG